MPEKSKMVVRLLISIISLISSLLCLNCEPLEIFDICTPENDKCLTISSCPHMIAAIKDGYKPKICSYVGKEPVVCCTKDINRWKDDDLTISGLMCDKYWIDVCPNSVPFVLGGVDALPKELPFMALIGYGSQSNILWKCGGSLISPKFVLSAAHCVQPGGDRPSWVRLGELDRSTFLDDAKPQNFRIKQIIVHPGYKYPLGYYDIALFRLEKDAKFNDYIRPICLSQSPSLVGVGELAGAAGWGAIDYGASSSKKLLKVDLEMFDPKGCYRTEYRGQIPRGIDENSMLCAGSREGGKDTCSGDSGGPLFQKPNAELLSRSCFLYTQIGITSFGYQCGLRNYPAIYTKVNHYLPWIEAIVWPTNVTDSSIIWSSK